MPEIQVKIVLPYLLRLHDGDYPSTATGEAVQIKKSQALEGTAQRTAVLANFHHPETADLEEKRRLQNRDAEQLLRRTNCLLRWYRSISRQSKFLELTRSQAGPFLFQVVGTEDRQGWLETLEMEKIGPKVPRRSQDFLTNAVRAGLASGREPEVAELFLLDAERSLYEGRFREAVLLSWSVIDAVFNRKYDALVNTALAGEWSEAREFFTGVDFGLRHKMSAVMHLIADRSLFREPDDLWGKLSASYRKRNAIIHRGDNATEDDGRLALQVAQRIADIMGSL